MALVRRRRDRSPSDEPHDPTQRMALVRRRDLYSDDSYDEDSYDERSEYEMRFEPNTDTALVPHSDRENYYEENHDRRLAFTTSRPQAQALPQQIRPLLGPPEGPKPDQYHVPETPELWYTVELPWPTGIISTQPVRPFVFTVTGFDDRLVTTPDWKVDVAIIVSQEGCPNNVVIPLDENCLLGGQPVKRRDHIHDNHAGFAWHYIYTGFIIDVEQVPEKPTDHDDEFSCSIRATLTYHEPGRPDPVVKKVYEHTYQSMEAYDSSAYLKRGTTGDSARWQQTDWRPRDKMLKEKSSKFQSSAY